MTITGDVHDFDFLAGTWAVRNRRLRERGVGSDEWDEFDGVSRCSTHLGGVVNTDEITFPTKGFTGFTMRAFDRAASQWSIWWVNSGTGVLEPPVVGGFTGSRGEFLGDDTDDGAPVRVRFVWTHDGGDTARWEQSFDRGDGWEVNWVMEFSRLQLG